MLFTTGDLLETGERFLIFPQAGKIVILLGKNGKCWVKPTKKGQLDTSNYTFFGQLDVSNGAFGGQLDASNYTF